MDVPGILFGGIDTAITAFQAYDEYKRNRRIERITITTWDITGMSGFWRLKLVSERISCFLYIARAKSEHVESKICSTATDFLEHYCVPTWSTGTFSAADNDPVCHVLYEIHHMALGENDISVQTVSFLVSYSMYLLNCDAIKVNEFWDIHRGWSNAAVRERSVVLVLPAASSAARMSETARNSAGCTLSMTLNGLASKVDFPPAAAAVSDARTVVVEAEATLTAALSVATSANQVVILQESGAGVCFAAHSVGLECELLEVAAKKLSIAAAELMTATTAAVLAANQAACDAENVLSIIAAAAAAAAVEVATTAKKTGRKAIATADKAAIAAFEAASHLEAVLKSAKEVSDAVAAHDTAVAAAVTAAVASDQAAGCDAAEPTAASARASAPAAAAAAKKACSDDATATAATAAALVEEKQIAFQDLILAKPGTAAATAFHSATALRRCANAVAHIAGKVVTAAWSTTKLAQDSLKAAEGQNASPAKTKVDLKRSLALAGEAAKTVAIVRAAHGDATAAHEQAVLAMSASATWPAATEAYWRSSYYAFADNSAVSARVRAIGRVLKGSAADALLDTKA